MLFNKEQYKHAVKVLKISATGALEDYFGSSSGSIDFNEQVKPLIERVRALQSAYVAYHQATKESSLSLIAKSAHTIAECRDWLDNVDGDCPDLIALIDTMLADVSELLYKETRISEPECQFDTLFDD